MPKTKKIIVLDMETDPFDGHNIPQPFLACVYDGQTYNLFAEFSDMPVDLKRKCRKDGIKEYSLLVPYLADKKAICYAHNGGKFDYLYFKPYIRPGTEILVISGRMASFKIGQCEFRDSYNLFSQRLGAWEKDTIDYSFFTKEERYKPENWQAILDYQKSDCTYLYEMLTEFFNRNGKGITLPSICMNKLKKVMPGIPNSTKAYYEEFKPFYYGGRVQCFQKGMRDLEFQSVDINSAYPWAMRNNLHPIGLANIARRPRHIKEKEAMGPQFYKIEAESGGGLPFRDPKTKELTFPCDDVLRTYFVTGWELMAALDTNTVCNLKILTECTFKDCRDFADFIDPLWEERLKAKREKDEHTSNFVKLEMNSTYGKFAANPAKYEDFMVITADEAAAFQFCERDFDAYKEQGYKLRGSFGPETYLISRPIGEDDQTYYNVVTGASITGCVRALLFRNMCKAKDLLYCDTDSIAARSFPDLNIGDKLGQWGIEGDFDHYRISDKKVYAFHFAERPMGYNRNAIKKKNWKMACKGGDLTPNEIKQLCQGKIVTYHRTAPTYSIYKEPFHMDRDFKMSQKPTYRIEVKQ